MLGGGIPVNWRAPNLKGGTATTQRQSKGGDRPAVLDILIFKKSKGIQPFYKMSQNNCGTTTISEM